ncbi:Do family serine endopeptidase [Ciceribacter sp. L1K22]|uniref:Do family serine endopeptidase n=1 Tax=Ciceribacter sp. L1K22 TaxID=2820275 RepID=UPI001ABE13C0|nr:Do family serine endopeptidase [Ciceribacter sp. L1K22]MBO3759512.1 Do family serine endopeptidase [Ciceribacter sp. L1K22]
MFNRVTGQNRLAKILRSTTAMGLAAAIVAGGVPAIITPAYAEPVSVEAPNIPSFADVVEAVSPAVVSVRVESAVQPAAADGNGFSFGWGGRGFDELPDDHPMKRFFREFGIPMPDGEGQQRPAPHAGKGKLRPTSQGSGFFISEDGYIVTNNHVVNDGEAFTIVMNDGTELKASLVGKDSRTDLAVLKVDEPKQKFKYVKFADGDGARIGDWVVAVGNPFGLGGTVTAGIVSARGRDIGSGPYDDYIQIDAAVNRGNSGGPDFNLSGEVIGINTAIFSPSGGNVGIAFAIPASLAKNVVNDLIEKGTVERGWLGVQIDAVSKDIADSLGLAEAAGAIVVAPQDGSPGAKAGIEQGDVIVAVDGEQIKDNRDLAKRIGTMTPGTKVELSIWREGKSITKTVELGTFPTDQQLAGNQQDEPAAPAPSTEQALAGLGLDVQPSDDGSGLAIVSVDPDSEAADLGLKAGDRITAVNNEEVSSVADAQKAIEAVKEAGRTKVLVLIQTDNGNRFVALPLDQG